MIRIFDERETDFSHDGIEILDDITISCISEREINGTWFLNAEFLRDEDKSTSIENRRILKVPTAINEQLFRIVSMKVTKSKIMVYAEHIFFDNRYNFIADTYVVQKDGNNALQQMIGACQYKNNFRGLSTIPTIASARLVRKTFIDAIMGDSDNSFINRWGGEIELDNFDFKIKSEIGENRGVEVTYGHNMQGFEGEIDESGVITRVMPEGFNGILLPEKYVDSPLIDNYAFPRIQKIYISSIKVKENPEDEDGFDTEEEAHEALRQYVANLYAIENIDKPSVNIRVNFINLEKTDQFKNEVFEKVYLGDTLKVNLEKYGFDVTSRVISERYDNRNDRFVEIELGHSKVNVLKEVSNVQQTIDGILEQLKQQNSWEGLLDQARDEATKLIQEGIKNSFVVARKNEILIMDSENVETAKSVIRMNKNGIGFSQTGYNGPYIIGITIDGKINADCITSGIINAALIRAGRLQSLNNKTWISMEDGSFSLAGGKITFDDVNGLKIWLSNNEESDLETSLNNYKQQVSNDIKQLTDKVNNIDSNIGGAFVDGIIDTVEKNIIEDSLLKLDKEKKDVDSRYQNVYNNVNLLDPFKTNLYTKYNNFVSKYNTLVSTINTIIEDNVATAEEKVRYKTAMNNYNRVIPELTVAFDEAISSIGEKITTEQINDLNDLLKQDIKNVSDSLGSLENTMNNSFRDGIINEAEYTAILESLKRLDTEKLDIDKNYNNLYSDINLSSTVKTNLKNKYDSYVSSHNNLTNYINNTIGDRVATEEEKAQIKILLNAYNVALSDYGVTQTQAINDIANNSANKMLESYKQLVNKDISDINQKINDIKNDVGGAIADGIIEEAETLIIQNSIDQLNREKEDLDQRYQEIYNNNHLSSTTKQLLSTRYLDYNTAHTNLINQINTMIQDKVATETEKVDYKRKLQTYNSSLSLVSRCFDTAINEIAQNNLNSVTEKLKKELQGNIDDVSNIANELNKNFGNYTADGILTESEKASIRTYLNTLSAEKSDIDNQYKATYENTDLTGVPKTNLLGAYNNYVTAYNNLVSYINTLLSKTTIVENDRATLNTRFSEHDSYLSKYSTAINNAIDAISQKKKQDAIDSSKDYYDTQIIIDKNGILSTVKAEYTTKSEFSNVSVGINNRALQTATPKSYTFGNKLNDVFQPYIVKGDVRNTECTVIFDFKGNVTGNNTDSGIRFQSMFTHTDGTTHYSPTEDITSQIVGKTKGTVKMKLTWGDIKEDTNTYIRFRGDYLSGTITISNVRVVKGNVNTSWSPAPEDTENYIDDCLSNMSQDLQGQIDGKIETYNQTSDPSTSWNTDEIKNQHKGDLWYNPNNQLTKRWSGTAWVNQQGAEPLAMQKKRVFTTTPTSPYDIGDLWVTDLTGKGEIKTCINARAELEPYIASDWILGLKYTDNTLAEKLQTELNNMTISVRNIAEKTNQGTTGWSWHLQSGSATLTEVIENDIRCCKMTRNSTTSTGWSYIGYSYIGRNKYEPNKQYTVSFEVKSSVATKFWVSLMCGDSTGAITNSVQTQTTTKDSWTKLSVILTTVETFPSATEQVLYLNSMDSSVGVSYIFRNLKITEGNKETGWSQAPEDTSEYVDNLLQDLKTQVDGKIETWSQTTDPALSWTTTELKTQHTGDLWYNTADKITKRWNGTQWVVLENAEAKNATELAKTKKRVFTGTPITPYDVGDLWITDLSSTGDIKVCKVARAVGSYTSTDWVKAVKYTDDTFANQLQTQLNNMVVGGKNLIKNSALDGSKYWELSSSASVDTSTKLDADCNSLKISSTGLSADSWRGATQKILLNTTISKGREFVVSGYFMVKDKSLLDYSFACELKGDKSDGSGSISISSYPSWNKDNIVENKWTYFNFTVKATTDFKNIYIYPWVRRNGTVWFTKLQVEEGNTVSSWSPAPEDTESYVDDLVYDLQEQLDGKIETWSQPNDPSTAWTTTELKTKHKGDLWYNTSNAQTKRWSATAWELQPEAETLAKEKKRIFTETPTIPYDIGDLWILPSNSSHSAGKQGEILTCVTSRASGSYTSSDWQKKIAYTDDTYVKSVESSIRQTVDSVEMSVQSMRNIVGEDLFGVKWLQVANWKKSGSMSVSSYRSATPPYIQLSCSSTTSSTIGAYIEADCIPNKEYLFKFEIFSKKASNASTPYNVQLQGLNRDGSWSGIRKFAASISVSAANRVAKSTKVTIGDYTKLRVWIGRENNANAFDIGIANLFVGVEGQLATESSIQILSDKIQLCVTNDQMGTVIQQNAAAVRIAWNNNSKYVQFENGKLALYDAQVSDSKKRAVFDQNGIHFWRDGYYVGKMGTNVYTQNTSLKGIVFDLEPQGAYMTWAAKRSSSETNYLMKLFYASQNLNGAVADRVHLGCDLDMHNYTLRNVKFEGGGITGTMNFVQVKAINGDGTVANWYNNCKLTFQNGILTSATWGD